jgi:hypothetical protein
MHPNIKAALLSALVLPGLGQLVKGHKLKGIVLISLVNIFLLVALASMMRGVMKILRDAATTGKVDLGEAMTRLQLESPFTGWLLLSFFIIWAYAVADALLDRDKDHERQEPGDDAASR